MFGLALSAAAAAAQPAGADRYDGPQWPNISSDQPRAGASADGARWPNIRLDDVESKSLNPSPGFIDPEQVEARIMGRQARVPARPVAVEQTLPVPAASDKGYDANASVAARWPNLLPDKPASPFAFEVGTRYWYSSGQMKFGLANGNPFFGVRTSTLDWMGLDAHSGELFARIDHKPTGFLSRAWLALAPSSTGR